MNEERSPIRLFATDVDDTVLGDAASADQFRQVWESLEVERRPLLVYNSSRTVRDVEWLILERKIPAAEFIIGGIGTELQDPVDPHVAEEFRTSVAAGWDRAAGGSRSNGSSQSSARS